MNKIIYVDNIENFDYEYLPIYKKCDNGKYLQLCTQKLSVEIIKENADPTALIIAIDNFCKPAFNELRKKLNVNFIELKIEEDEEKKLIINKYMEFQKERVTITL